jgi:tetratricopeptide (TPR) repeat protein
MERYEVFLSYHHEDAAVAKPLYEALGKLGLKVFFDEVGLASHESITRRLDYELAHSKILVAVYSKTYPTRWACQFELTAAFLAAQRAGDPRDRVLVVNPDEGEEVGHIEPIELRDAVFDRLRRTDSPERFEEVAVKIAHKVLGVEGVFGDSRLLSGVPWHGRRPISSPEFVGRLSAMWEIHSALHASELRPITGDAGPAVAQLVGIGGQGKTMLAEEYALRFASANPGGVFWLTVPAGKAKSGAARDASRKQLIKALATSLGAPIAELTKAEDIEAALQGELERRGETHLWVVDDVPDGMQADELRSWLAPHRLGKTLLLTQTHAYEEFARKIKLEELPPQEAGELLARHRAPEGESEREEAARLAEDLARHAMALKVAGSALEVAAGPKPYADFRSELEDPSKDALELAAELTDTLATGHDPSIAKTLLLSVARVRSEATDVLRLASQLANTPIPSSFIDRVLGVVDKRSESEARERGMRARKDLVKASLSELVENGTAISVHSLVARTMRFAERNTPDRLQQLRSVATAVLNEDLDLDHAEGIPAGVEHLIPHARQLAITATTTEETTLASHLANYDYQRGAFASARELQEQVLKNRREAQGEHHPETLTAMSGLALTLFAQGNLEQARELQEQVLKARREVLGERHPETFAAMSNLAGMLRILSELVDLPQTLHPGRRQKTSTEIPEGVSGQTFMADPLGKARELQEQILEARREVLGERHLQTLIAMSNLAGTLSAQRKLGEARELKEQVLRGFREVVGERHSYTLAAMSSLATTLRELGGLDELGQAHELEERVLKFTETPRTKCSRRSSAQRSTSSTLPLPVSITTIEPGTPQPRTPPPPPQGGQLSTGEGE